MPWHRVGFLTAVGLRCEFPLQPLVYPRSAQFTQGMCWRRDTADHIRPINRFDETIVMTKHNAMSLATPSSHHVDGVNVGFADGATRFIVDSIDAVIYRAMLRPGENAAKLSPTIFPL